MRAITYYLRKCVGFDFLTFLVMARTLGYDEVILDDSRGFTNKFAPDESRRRVDHILIPAGEFAGMKVAYGQSNGDNTVGVGLRAFLEFARPREWAFTRLMSVRPAAYHRYTVTLRHNARKPIYNSNELAWRRFADLIGAHVIEDAADKYIDIRDQMALYAGAEMNFMLQMGPSNLCWLSDAPCMMFMPVARMARTDIWSEIGFFPGDQYGCFLKTQRIIWAADTYENLVSVAAWLGIEAAMAEKRALAA